MLFPTIGNPDQILPYTPSVSSTLFNNPPPPNLTAVADGLQNLIMHPHPQRTEWLKGFSVCRKSYDQVIEETVADYLNQTAQPRETVRERQIERNAFIDGIHSAVFTFCTRECHRLPSVTA